MSERRDALQAATRDEVRCKGVYRFLASLLSPETLISMTARVWNTYWNGGQTQYLELRKGMATLQAP